jgi:hypothetical protein
MDRSTELVKLPDLASRVPDQLARQIKPRRIGWLARARQTGSDAGRPQALRVSPRGSASTWAHNKSRTARRARIRVSSRAPRRARDAAVMAAPDAGA